MSPAPQQSNSVLFDTAIQVVPVGTLASQDLTGLPVSATATATSTSESTSSPSSSTASPLDDQAHGSGKNIGIAIGIAIAIIFLAITSTLLIFCSRKRKQAKQARYSEARLIRRSEIEDAPPPYLPSKAHFDHNSMQKGDLPATATRPQGIVINERAVAHPNPPLRPVNAEPPLPLRAAAAAPPLRSDTQPSMPMTHMTEGSWATLPTMSTQPTLPKAWLPGRLAPLPNENMHSRFSF